MFTKFSEDAQKILMNAKKEMKELRHSYVGSEHLFLSFLKLDNEFKDYMSSYGVTYTKFKNKLISVVGKGSDENNWFLYTPLLKRIIESSMIISRDLSSSEVITNHMIYALFDEGEGIALRILDMFDLDIDEIYDKYSGILVNKKKTTKNKLLVESFGIDLTKKAKVGELDPVVGRNIEVKRLMEILCRRTKNNPLLIGDAGVGKTAIIEELARLIVEDKVPNKLKNKRIISVSIASLVSGTKYRGEFEERITKMLKELEDNPDIYLFIDEVHTIMGAGGAEGAIDAANIFKPALSRGKIKVIGATTLDEYKKTIEKDKAMERRFQTILVKETNFIDTYNILKEIKTIYENYHHVKISDYLVKKIIELSNTYITNRKEPDRSIDILDEVCSKVSLNDNKSFSKLYICREELMKIKEEKNKYLIRQDYSNARKIKNKEKELITKINNLELKNINKRKIKEIKLSDITTVISNKSGVPIYEIEGINNKYIDLLSKNLHKSVIGQDEAILELVNTTKRIKLGYKDNSKPVSLLFVGPTGVGKTRLALEYAKHVFNNKIIRFDGSEYKEESSINKILGSSPGYVGYDDNKNKLEEVKNNPYSLILFDEIDKACPNVLNLFLQILDEGKITDNKGNIIYFNNCIIIMTSNIGCGKDDIGFTENNSKVNSKLIDFLSIELLNRIKKIVYFNKLSYDNIYSIIKSKLTDIKKNFNSKNIKIHISRNIINSIVDKSKYKEYGARKIDYVLEDIVDKYIIDNILLGKKEIYINN